MPATLRSLVADRALGVRPLCADGLLDRTVSWAHISELDDPTVYLDGGELLLTTGLALGDGTDHDAFVARLVAHGLAGLGFGTGLSHATVPSPLVDAARRHGFALLEIPERTPFIAITKAVSAALAADAYAQVVRTDEARRALTAAALGNQGTGRVLRQLARRLDAWVLLLDASGRVEHAAPASAARRLAGLAPEVERVRHHHGPTSRTVPTSDGCAVLQPLRLRGRAVLAIGRTAGFAPADMQIVGAAVSVLTLLHATPAAVEKARGALRTTLLRTALAGQAAAAWEIAAEMEGPQPAPPLRAVVFRGRLHALADLADVIGARSAEHGPLFTAHLDGAIVALAAADGPVPEWLAGLPGPGVHAGVSEPVGLADLAAGHVQAERAAAAAQRAGAPSARFTDLAAGGLQALLPAEDTAAFAAGLLGPLRRHDADHGTRLVESLREWLGHHGHWDATATDLGVHRHTLRARIRRAEVLLGRSLDSPGLRAELWFALHAPAEQE
ncbi:PucR family transcriptional regulator [Pseudonocardia sp.]|uniref:PucR family transcriptional regulator n=1 Tax=Pseudonocardia sp. TaxID=60912 RepID=UPI003D0F001B